MLFLDIFPFDPFVFSQGLLLDFVAFFFSFSPSYLLFSFHSACVVFTTTKVWIFDRNVSLL